MDNIKDYYFSSYSNNSRFRQYFLSPKRIHLYQTITQIIKEINITSAVDIGCSYGLLVELLNSEGINAWGLDLPIPELKEFHNNLTLSKGKFIYGLVEDEKIIKHVKMMNFQAIILLDTLRYIEKIENILYLGADFIIIKEVSDNFYIRSKRKGKDLYNFSPIDLLHMFPKYHILRIYSTKFLFHIEKPSSISLKLINLLPTYTVVLKRLDNSYS